jgi:hypothetical protein
MSNTPNGGNMTFLPVDYEVPQASGSGGKYFKPQKGENRVRILTDCITGWLYWNSDDKPMRLRDRPTETPDDIRVKDGKQDRVRHFWAMVIYDYASAQIAIWEITQGTIQSAIAALATDADWGHPRQYDLKITRTGEGLDTEYTVVPSPIKPVSSEISQAYLATPVNLYALYDGANPFDAEKHSHSINMSVADAVTAMVADAKARGVDVKTVCKQSGLPTKASEYDEAMMLRLEDALQPHLETEIAYEDIPF